VNTSFQRVRELRHILVRLGAGPSGRYWSNAWQVFANNVIGGAITGVIASVFAAVLLGLDLQRGRDSLLYHAIRILQALVLAVQTFVNRELHQ
jgi:hypothetical protein